MSGCAVFLFYFCSNSFWTPTTRTEPTPLHPSYNILLFIFLFYFWPPGTYLKSYLPLFEHPQVMGQPPLPQVLFFTVLVRTFCWFQSRYIFSLMWTTLINSDLSLFHLHFSCLQEGALQHEQVVVEALVYMVRVTSVQVKLLFCFLLCCIFLCALLTSARCSSWVLTIFSSANHSWFHF